MLNNFKILKARGEEREREREERELTRSDVPARKRREVASV
jgi:hypothetical protein